MNTHVINIPQLSRQYGFNYSNLNYENASNELNLEINLDEFLYRSIPVINHETRSKSEENIQKDLKVIGSYSI